MSPKIWFMISTGPLEEDWLVAEIYVDEMPFGELREWGNVLIVYQRTDGKQWDIPVDQLIETISLARKRVQIPNNEQSDDDWEK